MGRNLRLARRCLETGLLAASMGVATGACAPIASADDASNPTAKAAPMTRIVVIDAPSNLGLRPPAPGVEPGARKLAAALRDTGLVARLGAREGGRVDAPAYSPDPDHAVGFRNGTALAAYSRTLADRLEPLLGRDEFVLVLGGDCSVLLGSSLALKRRGRYGLAFVDAHDDYSYARDRKRYRGIYTAAGLDLGLATGHGPAALTDIDGRSPYLRESDVVQLGLSRTPADSEFAATESYDASGIHTLGVNTIRRDAHAAGAEARARLEAADTQGYWIHVDADVLDARVMPAVDSPNERGLSFGQLRALLAPLLASPKAVGLELTIYDPDLDPDGRYGARLARTIEAAFADSGRFTIKADRAPRGARR
ncbi:arginase family protein [Lysobacter sp. Root916]|uniref:arginase family protein n=1 Tax=Lysobacter sp. Root916 TaxID=1736606 RepID=UPI000A465F82|nr:arginase family protein [Lysobacter sp. Root916]